MLSLVVLAIDSCTLVAVSLIFFLICAEKDDVLNWFLIDDGPLSKEAPTLRFLCGWLGGFCAWATLVLAGATIASHRRQPSSPPLGLLGLGASSATLALLPPLVNLDLNHTARTALWALAGLLFCLHVSIAVARVARCHLDSGIAPGRRPHEALISPLLLPSACEASINGAAATVATSSTSGEEEVQAPVARDAVRTLESAPAPDAANVTVSAAAAIELAEREAAAQRALRGFGTLTLLRIAWPHRWWLYAGCSALLVRLPLSLSVPHWVAETIGALSTGDHDRAMRCIMYLCVMGTGDALGDFWCIYLFVRGCPRDRARQACVHTNEGGMLSPVVSSLTRPPVRVI